jgi:transcriptional regulator with XRE-family HTH domain
MLRTVSLDSDELRSIKLLGRRVRLTRLRRNLSQEQMAERAGVTRKTYSALEAGAASTSVALVVKVMSILGYPERIPALLESDPIGEELEEFHGRKHAGGRSGVADF